jgi:hypothetical protein
MAIQFFRAGIVIGCNRQNPDYPENQNQQSCPNAADKKYATAKMHRT